MPIVVALAILYICGLVTGSVLVEPRGSFAWAIVRLVVGLLLTAVTFLASLVAGIPWFVGPLIPLAAALVRRRGSAFHVPAPPLRLTAQGVGTGVLASVLVAPVLLSAARMAPGPYPPVFFSVDNAYFMEQVQSLADTSTYPPGSLSNLGGRRTYHYGIHGMAAFVSRASGLRPHQALYGVIVPVLVAGTVAAAVAAARALAPAIPLVVSVPLLLISVPTFWYPFWGDILEIFSTGSLRNAIATLGERYEVWGVATIEAHNVAANVVVLAALASIGAARSTALTAFLIGTAIIVKTSAGVALVAGFVLAQAYRVLKEKDSRPIRPVLAVIGVFAATYIGFWVMPSLPPDFRTEPSALYHLGRMSERGALSGLAIDLLWLSLPVAVVAAARAPASGPPSLPLLLLAIAPLIVVNTTSAVDVRPGGGGGTDDWLQILSPFAVLLHAFVLAFANRRWPALGRPFRTAYVVLVALAVLPVVWVAGRYSLVLVLAPERGHEFADNRVIAEALAAIPVGGTIVVTNDLRYPADNFNRDDRQMQIPALWGHQAFAVNYRYETFAFSADRRQLQALLASEKWSVAIEEAARMHGWTHLLIHKPYVHPAGIPLTRIFENDRYAVYRFARQP